MNTCERSDNADRRSACAIAEHQGQKIMKYNEMYVCIYIYITGRAQEGK